MNEIIPINYENDRQTVSGRSLHEFLEVGTEYAKWISRMFEYGFSENADFVVIVKSDENPLGGRPSTDHQLTIEMAKEICMLQRNDKGKQARQYFIELEKKWNSPESVMARALKMADAKILSFKVKVDELETENKVLAGTTLEWANRNVLNAIIRAYGAKVGFEEAWRDFKKELLYNHGININQRVTNRMNQTGKKTKPATLSLIHDDEISKCVSTAVALCKTKEVDISGVLKKFNKPA